MCSMSLIWAILQFIWSCVHCWWFSMKGSVAHFLSTLQDKVSWRPNFNRTRCPDEAKTVGHKTCRKQNPWLWTKPEKLEVHITDNQSRSSCHRVASDHEFTFSLSRELTKKKHNVLWLCAIHGHLLQPKHGASTVRMHLSTRVCFPLTWGLNLVGKQLQACPLHRKKKSGTRDHQNCILTWPRS